MDAKTDAKMNTEQPTASPPLIGELTPEQFRLKLAGLADPDAAPQGPSPQDAALTQHATTDVIRATAIQFIAILPELFGESLDRKTLWDRIGTGLQSAYAKTPGCDHEYFIQQVLDHIKSEPAKAAGNARLAEILAAIGEWQDANRQAFISCFNSRLIPMLVHAKVAWEAKKEERKADRSSKKTSPNAVATETLFSFTETDGAQ